MKTPKLPLAILAVIVSGAMSAMASFTVSFVNVNPEVDVGLHVSGDITLNSGVQAGIYNLLVAGAATPSFCIDVQRDAGSWNDYNYNPLANSPLFKAGPMGSDAATDIEKLWAAYYTGATTSSLEAGALQLAIWETVAKGAGNYTVTADAGAVATRAGEMIGNLKNLTSQADLMAVVSESGQNYVIPVPEPSTMVAGALLLLPFGASTIRILRKKVTA